MVRQTVVPEKARKKRGPLPTGKGVQIGTRWHEALIQAIDAWSAKQEGALSRSDAIRRLVQIALASEGVDVDVAAPAPEKAARSPKLAKHTAKPAKAAPPQSYAKKTRARRS